MIIQRAGRLWRHEQNNPYRVQGAKPELLVITPESDVLNTNLLYAFGASGIVYSPYVLARSMEVISTAQLIAIPSGIRDLIEKTYMERDDERNFLEAYNKLQQDKEKLRRFALLSVASKGRTLSESAATRYSDIVYCDVLLLKQEVIGESGLLRFTDDSELRFQQIPERIYRIGNQSSARCISI
jgi:CRISPR-associated endonuclease/helicase Cas3